MADQPQEGMTTSESLQGSTTSSAQREREARERAARQEAEDRGVRGRLAQRKQASAQGQIGADENVQASTAQEAHIDVEGFIARVDEHLQAIHEAAMQQIPNSDELAAFLNSLAAVNTSKVHLRDALLEQQALQRDMTKEQVQQDLHEVAQNEEKSDV